MGSNYYSPRPNFLNIGVDPQHKKEVEDSFKGMQNPIRRGCIRPLPPCPPPMGDKGFMVRNNARLAYTAVFDFEYDDQSRVHSEVSEGDKVFATFNNSTKGEFKVVTITAILKKIEPINDGKDFVLYLDASEENNSSVYKIGSRVLLDIGRILEDGETRKDLDPAETVEEITHPVEFPPYPPALPPCPPPPGHHHGHHPCPPPSPGPRPYWPLPKKPEVLTWSDKSTEVVYAGDDLGYNICNITYSKKKPIQTMLIIYSLTGEVVYKAVDNSLKLSSLANFTWDLRNYSDALHDIPMLDKLENFTVDSTGRIVLTPYDKYSEKAEAYIKSVQKSNDHFVKPGEYFIEIAAGPDIINYNPLAIAEINKNRIAISTKINITAEAIIQAAYNGPVVSPDKDAQDVINNLTDQDAAVTFKAGDVKADELAIDANTIPYAIVLKGSKENVSAATGDRANEDISADETVIKCPVKISGDHDVTLDGLVFTEDAKLDLTNFEGNLTITNSKFVKLTDAKEKTKTMGITIPSTVTGQVAISNNYFGSSNSTYYNGLEINAVLGNFSSISGNYFDPKFCSHNAINIYNVEENATINIKDNIMDSDNFLRIGIKGEPKCTINIENNTIKSADPLDPVWNSPILVQPYNKATTSFENCTINITNLKGLAKEAKPILVAASNNTDTDITDKLPIVNVDGKKYEVELIKF